MNEHDSENIEALLVALGVLVILIICWSVRQIAVDNMTTNIVSYVDSYNEE
jgi:hypothetical protein